ncbi:MAG: four helix bundle suffix domain-containing protein [Patescibacteria group bacterium]|nr:four helix bundle suffix domain-containing protein [Patescibacteria group bacterium]MCL5095264.1 four helix bundle suffix domain-containing protein [Patescibacteria group bacterium]
MTNMTHKTNRGGYESLVVYWLATTIHDLTVIFCQNYIDKKSRTFDQMVQAARSGKQNIVEGSLEKSVEGNLKLTGIARASFGELLEDFKDFLRQRNLLLWDKDNPQNLEIRRTKDLPNKSYTSYLSYMTYTRNPEGLANLLITLCYKQSFLLDRLLKAIEEKFIREGGFRENLFKKRHDFKRTL